MKYAVLDTNFLISCVNKKINFFSELESMGLKTVIPAEVKSELEHISISGQKKFQNAAKIALLILKKNSFKEISLGMKNVDQGLIELANKDEDYIVATLDQEIKNKIRNNKIIIKGSKKLELI